MTIKLALQACRVTLRPIVVGACALALLVGGGLAPLAWAAGTVTAPGSTSSAGTATTAIGFQFKPWPRGKAAPELIGTDLQGQTWNLKALRGQPVLINFWASWCEPCRAEMPSLQALTEPHEAEAHEAKPRANLAPQVLAVNFKESAATAQRYVQQTQLRLPVLRDADGAWAKQWGVSIFPSTVLVGADGKVRGTVVGELDWTSDAARPLLRRLSRE